MVKTIRCAIYTRKSTEEGLDQDFNSLDAQREAAEAFIKSQKHAGWALVPSRYDDGGYSGGTLERPAMRHLLDDIDQGRLDCVVVYKVDRLSRSLLDFARLMDRFDQRSVSFVSVTQQFNTTSSLGRLTLNILLSFAQFEREIISERTRDKMSAARRKGKWVGGVPMLGYDIDPAGGRLVINQKEAQRVRQMFDLYLKHHSLPSVVAELERERSLNKSWKSQSGRKHPARPFTKASLQRLLTNAVYAGNVEYRGTIYKGEHDAIIDTQVWDDVNAELRAGRRAGPPAAHVPQNALLAGLLDAAILPALMLLYDVTWPRSQAWRDRILPYLVLIPSFGTYLYLRSQVDTHLVVNFGENVLVGSGFWTHEITAIKVIGKLLGLFIWPARLSADYSFHALPLFGEGNWEDAKALIAGLACAVLVALAIRHRRNKPFFFVAGFFFVAIVPTSNILFIVGTLMAERFMYMPSLALCGCLIVAIEEFGNRANLHRPWLKPVLLGILILGCGARTYVRHFDWRDNFSLWSSAVAAYPNNARAHFGLGSSLTERSEIDKAIIEFDWALRIRPNYAEVHSALGNALEQMPGRRPDAVSEYKEALKLDSNLVDAHYNLGNALSRTPGRMQDAIAEWQIAVRIQPDLAEGHNNLGNAYSQIPGRLSEAIAEYQTAVRIRPDYAQAHNSLGTIYSQLPGRLTESVTEYQNVLRIQPDSAEAHTNLGFVLAQIPGRIPEAIAEYAQAIQLRPDLGIAHYQMGMALLQIPGRRSDAIEELETALRINPNPEGRRIVDQLRAGQH